MDDLLYDYQLDAVNRLKTGSILYGGVGAGKSRTAIAYYILKEREKELYIITTARKRDTGEWLDEIEQFQLGIVATIDSWNNISKYTDKQNGFFIFDEQRVVGSGVWVRSFLKITKNNNWILLSATPGDSWSDYIPVFVANGFYKNRTEFKAEHMLIRYTHNYPIIEGYTGIGKLKRLRDSILVGMDYEKQNERHHRTILCDYDKDLYKIVSVHRRDPYTKEPIENISQYYFLMRKVVNSDPSRIEAVRSILAVNKRAIIFYNFDYERDALKKVSFLPGTVLAEWNGHVHQPIPDSDRWVYLVQFNCVEGWNCTSTDTCIFFSQNYSYKTVEQASGRIDRVNNIYDQLYYYQLTSTAPIDVRISRALKGKKKFNESADFKKLYGFNFGENSR